MKDRGHVRTLSPDSSRPTSCDRLQFADFTSQGGIVGHPLADHPDNSGAVDQVRDAPAAVLPTDRSIIGEQWKT